MMISNEAASTLLAVAAVCSDFGFVCSSAAVGSVSDSFYDLIEIHMLLFLW